MDLGSFEQYVSYLWIIDIRMYAVLCIGSQSHFLQRPLILYNYIIYINETVVHVIMYCIGLDLGDVFDRKPNFLPSKAVAFFINFDAQL